MKKPTYRLLVLTALRYLVLKQVSPWGPSPRDPKGEQIVEQLDEAIEEEKKETE